VEETGLHIEIERFLCVHEFLAPPLHAIELFFIVYKTGGTLVRGVDPELEDNKQIITDVAWLGLEALSKMEDQSKHRIIHDLKEWGDLYRRSGFYTKQ
ncbi:MAG: NUDIX hydrolase, partial [Cytophagales bacterium]|nr:NUDIX hydrolase [Cytophaga sp.]